MATEIKLGGITVHRVVEQEAPIFAPLEFFPTLTAEVLAENLPWLSPKYIDPATGKLVLCVQSYLVRTPHHTILIDSCVGNHKPRPTRPFWNMLSSDRYEKNLAAAGVGMGDIACGSYGLEHAAGERALGARLPEGQVPVRRSRAGALDRAGEGECRELPLDHRFRAADRGGRPA